MSDSREDTGRPMHVTGDASQLWARWRRSARRSARWSTVLALVMGAVLAACGSNDSSAPPSPEPAPEPESRRPQIPEDGDTVVVQFTSGGGIDGPCCDRWALPSMTVYGDGRVVLADGGAGPVPTLRQTTVDPADLADLFADAAEAGLLDDPAPDTGTLCCDLSETDVVLTDATAAHELSVVGLGGEDNANADLTADQREARESIIELHRRLESLARQGDDEGPHAADELAVYAFASEVGPDVEAPPPWPLAEPLAQAGVPIDPDGRCLHLTTDSDRVLAAAAARDATSSVGDASTIWTSAGRTWHVIMRPLLPHEHGCP